MIGMVLGAGLGTRLRPLTDRLPKPVVPLFDRPLAAYALERLFAAGVRDAVMNTHHRAGEVVRALEAHVPEGMRLRFVHEPELLGTGGGIRNALSILRNDVGGGGPMLVINGDVLFWPDLESALALHAQLGAVATMVLREDPRAKELGAIEVDGGGRVRRLLGKPEGELGQGSLRELMFTGVHVLSPRALDELPEEGCVIRKSYRRWVDEGETVGGFVDAAPWRDLGTPQEYLRAHLDALEGALVWPGRALPRGTWIAPGARVEGARVVASAIGQGAYVTPGVRLERCLLWPGARVEQSDHDAIWTPEGRAFGPG
ncbi:MAG: NTP transferase domain-containing protein [Sandaracinaceae bacterium]|nr:NTP transferase domain-containing protein [Sandaracinaceae bacterium]